MRNDTTGVAPRDVANLARALKADHNALLRSVMTWSSWWIHGADVAPGVLRLPLLVDPAGQRILEVFSDEQAARDFAAREWGDAGPAPAHVEVVGWDLFGAIEPGTVARVSFDQHSEHAFNYQGDATEVLAAWAAIARVEAALKQPDTVDDALSVVADFNAWVCVMARRQDEHELVFAPDSRGRVLAALFTAEDCAREFIDAVAEDLEADEVHTLRYAGADIFGLLRPMQLDGIVFNPLSHLQPVALSANVLERLVRDHARA